MTGKDKFQETCEAVCEKRGWSLAAHQIDVPTKGSRKQVVYFNFFNYETREMVKLHTVIGSTARIRPERLIFALELNFRLPHGCLAVDKENLVMVDTLILEEVDSVEFESAVDFLAKTGDQYEAALFARDEH